LFYAYLQTDGWVEFVNTIDQMKPKVESTLL